MNDEHNNTPDIDVIAMAKPAPKHESRLRLDQAIQREVQDAMQRKEYEIATMLADAGVPINRFENTPEGAKALQLCLQLMDIQLQKLVFQDDFGKSGYYLYRMGLQVGFVPCEIVRGVMI